MSPNDANNIYLERIASFKTTDECKHFALNAREKGREDLAIEAEKRAISISGEAFADSDEITRECIEAISAYEYARTTSKRTFRATRTWQMLDNRGAIGTVEHSVARSKSTMGYEILSKAGLNEYSFENIVLRHPNFFSEKCLQAAHERLQLSMKDYGTTSKGEPRKVRNRFLSTSKAVIRAIEECDSLGRKAFLEKYGYGEARQYQLSYQGKLYDSKAIYGVAYGYDHGTPLKYDDFSGGIPVVQKLSDLGFEVIDLNDEKYAALPQEDSSSLSEGNCVSVLVNRYERNTKARRECLIHHGAACVVCGMNFGEIFGSEFEGLIHVHHLKPISTAQGFYEVDPKNDLVPVCPNCHAMIHYKGGLRSLDELKKITHKKFELAVPEVLKQGGRAAPLI